MPPAGPVERPDCSDQAAGAIRLGRLPGDRMALAMIGPGLFGLLVGGIGWWQVASGGESSVLGFIMAGVGTPTAVLALLLAVLFARRNAGGRVSAAGLHFGGRCLAWSQVSWIGRLTVRNGREVLVAQLPGGGDLIYAGSIPRRKRDQLLHQVEQWAKRRIEEA